MRFLVDECTGPTVSRWLREQGHDVFSVFEQARGIDDEEVIQIAFEQSRVLITNDKDFGEKIYREKRPHKGIILLRLDDESSRSKILVLQGVIDKYSDRLANRFIVATETRIRISK